MRRTRASRKIGVDVNGIAEEAAGLFSAKFT